MPSIDLQRIPEYYHNYVYKVKAADLFTAMQEHLQAFSTVLQQLPTQKWDHSYAEGKWTVKELVQHVIDAERIFCYRALCFARKDHTELPGFDENHYVVHSGANARSGESLLEELQAVQRSSALLFGSFNEEQLESSGVANGNPVYVRGIGYILIGHTLHHLQILQERYL